MFIPAAQPFDFRKTLAVAGTAATQPVFEIGRITVRATIREAPGGVDATFESDAPLSDAQLATARERVAAHLGLQDELSGFYRRAASDRAFAPLLQCNYGLHYVRVAPQCDGNSCLDTARAIYGRVDAATMNTLASLYGEYREYWHFYLKAAPALGSISSGVA